MTREYSLDADPFLLVKMNGDVYRIMIFQKGSDYRRQEFPLVRWLSFTRAMDEIDNAANNLKTNNHQLTYSYHIGSGYYVSVAAGYWCVDIRYKMQLKCI